MQNRSSLPVAYGVTLLVFVVIDAVWLLAIAGPLVKQEAASLLRAEPDLLAAAAFYVIYAAGLVVLAVRPALDATRAIRALALGAVVGLTAYATFDLTARAIFQGWSWRLALIDMAWGTSASAVAAYAGARFALRVSRSGT